MRAVQGLNGSEWLLRLFSALCLCTSLVITVLAVLGLLLGLPAANCCNRVRQLSSGMSHVPSCTEWLCHYPGLSVLLELLLYIALAWYALCSLAWC